MDCRTDIGSRWCGNVDGTWQQSRSQPCSAAPLNSAPPPPLEAPPSGSDLPPSGGGRVGHSSSASLSLVQASPRLAACRFKDGGVDSRSGKVDSGTDVWMQGRKGGFRDGGVDSGSGK
eukprot:986377-Prorocentrum_minimum.AAC.1